MLRLLYQLIGIHYAKGNFDDVEAAVRSILATVPNELASLQFLGLVYYRSGRKAEAIELLDAAPAPHDVKQQFEGYVSDDFLSHAPYSAAAACRLQATHRDSNLAQAWYDLGLTLYKLGRPDRATFALRSALIARPEFPEALQALHSIGPATGDRSSGTDGLLRADVFAAFTGVSPVGLDGRAATAVGKPCHLDDEDE